MLSDAEKRARYDRFGHAGVDGRRRSPHFNDVDDIFAAFGDIFGDSVFGDLFGGGAAAAARRKGADVRCDVTLDLLEAARGVTKTVEFQRHETCDDCDGSGAKPGTKPRDVQLLRRARPGRAVGPASSACRRRARRATARARSIKDPCADVPRQRLRAQRRSQREVQIPAGVDDEMRVRIAGRGRAEPQRRPARRLLLLHHASASIRCSSARGSTWSCRVPITYAQAALGATLEVPTLDGRDELKIPAGTQSGEVFKLRGRGMPDPRARGVGDLLVQVNIEVPKKLTPRQEELLRELAEVEHANVIAAPQELLREAARVFRSRRRCTEPGPYRNQARHRSETSRRSNRQR